MAQSHAALAIAATILLSGLIGCRATGAGVAMSSDSPSPTLSLELAPHVRADADSDAAGTALTGATDDDEHPEEEGTWARLTRPFRRPTRIPLPRTDLGAARDAGIDLASQQQADVNQF